MVGRITVLMPARNAQRTVRAAVVSVLKVLPRDGRFLALDDASDDATGEILARMAREDGRVGVLTPGVNLGVAKALNVLLDAADTPLVARMDADDISLPWRFRHQLSALYREKLDVVFAPMIMLGHHRFPIQPQAPFSAGPGAAPYELLLINTLMHPTLLGWRSVFVEAGGYRDVLAEDWDLWMRMALKGFRMRRLAMPNLIYRRHAAQVSANDDWNSPQTSELHLELSRRLIGARAVGAFAALGSSSGTPNDVKAASALIEAVQEAAASFPSRRDRLSMRRTIWIAHHRMNNIYGTST